MYIYIYIYVYIYIYIYILPSAADEAVRGAQANIYIYMCVCVYIYMYVYMHVCMYVCIYIYIYIYIYYLQQQMKRFEVRKPTCVHVIQGKYIQIHTNTHVLFIVHFNHYGNTFMVCSRISHRDKYVYENTFMVCVCVPTCVHVIQDTYIQIYTYIKFPCF